MINFGEQLNLVVDKLSDKLGVAADAIMPMFMKQATIYGISQIVFLTIALILSIICVKKFLDYVIKYADEDNLGADTVPFSIVCIVGIVSLLCFVIGICMIGDFITALFNPEYWAFQKIMEMVRQ